MSLCFDSARLHNPDLTQEHHAWRDQLRRFIDREIAPSVDTWDEQGYLPDELWDKAAQFGLLGLGYPECYGGTQSGIDLHHVNIVSEELSRTSLGGLPSTLLSHGIGLPPVMAFGSEDLKAAIVPPILAGKKRISLGITEPSGGSDVARLQTTAVREGDHYIVNGRKTFISGGMGANWITTGVRTGGEGASGVSVLVIPTDLEGVSRTPLDKKQGWWCSDTATIYFDGVRVPVANLLGEEGHGFIVIANNFNAERMAMAVMMEGTANFGDIALLKIQCSQTLEFCAREAIQTACAGSLLPMPWV